MRQVSQRQIALAHSGVKLTGPAEGYGRKKELQVRQWLTSLPSVASDVALPACDEHSAATNFEDLPPLVKDLYRQLTDSTDGVLPLALDDAPTYPNSNIPRRPLSPKVPSTKQAVRAQSKVPQPPEPVRTSQQETPSVNSPQLSNVTKIAKQSEKDAIAVEPAVVQTEAVPCAAPPQPASPSKLDIAVTAAASSLIVSDSTLDAVTASERASNVAASAGKQLQESSGHAILDAACKTLACPPHLVATVRQAATALLKQAETEVHSTELAVHSALLQSVVTHEKYKQQVRIELQEARQVATRSELEAAKSLELLTRQLQVESSRADRAEQSLGAIQAVALQEKQRVQALKLELKEHQEASAKLIRQLEQTTDQLEQSASVHVTAVKHWEAQLQVARLDAKKAQEQAAAGQKQHQLLQKHLEAQVANLEAQLQSSNGRLAAVNQVQAELKSQLAAEAKARAAAEADEQAALQSLQEQAELTAEMQRLMTNSWVLQQRHKTNAARIAVLAPSSPVASKSDASRRETGSDRHERLGMSEAEVANRSPRSSAAHRGQAKDPDTNVVSSTAASHSQLGRSASRRREGTSVNAGMNDAPQQSEEDVRRKSLGLRQVSLTSSPGKDSPSSANSNNKPSLAAVCKDGAGVPKARQMFRSMTGERRLVAEAQKAERRAAANAVLEESRLQAMALEAAPCHLQCLGLAFRACILAPDTANSSVAQRVERLLTPGYRMWVDVAPAGDNAHPCPPQSNPLIPVCQAVIWLATAAIPTHICEQLSQTCTQGRRLIVLAPPSMTHHPQLSAEWSATSSTSPRDAAASDTLCAFISQAWEERILWSSSQDLQAVAGQIALRLGVCDSALKLVSPAVLRRAQKSAHPDLLHLNLPGLGHLNLEGNSMLELASGEVELDALPALSLGKSATADLCYALQHNSTIKLLSLANLPGSVIQAVARAVTAEDCGVLTLHSHNDIPVGALLGRAPPCTDLKLSRPVSQEDAAILHVILPSAACHPVTISVPSEANLATPSAAALCTLLSGLATLQKFNELDLSRLEAAASGCFAGGSTILDMSGCVVGSLGAQLLATRLQPHAGCLKHAAGLNATGCQLTPPGMQHVMELLRSACSSGSLQLLCLADNKCGPEGLSCMSAAFPSTVARLAVLDLSMNCLGNEGAHALALLLLKFPSLRCLGLGHNAIGSEGLKALCSNLTQLKQLQELQLGGNVLGDEGVVSLAAGLPTLSNLEVLALQDNYNLGVETGRCLGAALPSCSSLCQLNLAKAHLGPEGVRHLAAGVQGAPALAILNLELCKIRAAGALALAGPVSCAPSLQELVLARNAIGDAGVTALAQALSKSSTLARLDLRNNGIGQLGGGSLKVLLRTSCPLSSISLAGNREDLLEMGLEEMLATASTAKSNRAASNLRHSEAHSTGGGTTGRASTSQTTGSPSQRPNHSSNTRSRSVSAAEAMSSASSRPTSASSSTPTKSPQLISAKQAALSLASPEPATSLHPDTYLAGVEPRSQQAAQVINWEQASTRAYAPRAGNWQDNGNLSSCGAAGRLGHAGGSAKHRPEWEPSKDLQAGLLMQKQQQGMYDECDTSSELLETALERYRKK